MTNMTKQTEAISTERALKLALEAQIHKAGMNPVMQGECYLMHPEALQKLIEVAIRETLAEQPAQRKPLTDELEALFTNIDHAISSGAWNVQTGSQTWELIQEAKAAHGIGEKK